MKYAIWILLSASALIFATTTSTFGEDQPAKQWVWLASQGVWGYGYQIQDGPYRGLWRIDDGSKRAPVQTAPASDPYGFAALVNRIRCAAGLCPLTYDHDLSVWAQHNNVRQCRHGLGHHVSPNCNQNCAWNTPDAESVVQAWMNSPGHRANILDSSSSRFGIAFGPGPYWTMNTR
jgi:hypothetical protein